MKCRHCLELLEHTFLDLNFAPPSNAYLNADDLNRPEKYYPLKVKVCHHCWLVQTEDYAAANELFNSEYAYFSSTSISWLHHAAKYSQTVIEQLRLNKKSFVIEIASNDGYLLKNFVDAKIPCLGIEPTASTADAAINLGIPVLQDFFGQALGENLAKEGKKANLIIANNVYAHVPDINDFTLGLKAVLKPGGTITLEFPHLMQLINRSQFDTIYHEHFSYLSLNTVDRIFKLTGLRVWHVEQIDTHGGSLRVYGCHAKDLRTTTPEVAALIAKEADQGLQKLSTYIDFQDRANQIKNDLISFLIKQKLVGKKVAAYGAAAKGNTLLNYAGIKPDLIDFVCDASLAKQGKYMPGSHIPILPPKAILNSRPDFVIILPWNIADEVMNQNSFVKDWGGKFLIAIPELRII
jgi:SAM-dependent methyltransferase